MITRKTTIVEATNLSKTYYNNSKIHVPAVTEVNLKVGQGEILFIKGPNGSGKTTLLSMLGCLIKPSSGSIKIVGRDITILSHKELNAFRLRYIGFIFQSFRLLSSITALENVELVLNLSGIRRPASREKAKMIMEELQIFHRANFFPKSLSGGEKQRLAVARALVNDTSLILADEPTGSLDSQSGRIAIELLCQAARKRKKTVIIVSHDTRIQRYVDRVLYMEDGCLKEEGQR